MGGIISLTEKMSSRGSGVSVSFKLKKAASVNAGGFKKSMIIILSQRFATSYDASKR